MRTALEEKFNIWRLSLLSIALWLEPGNPESKYFLQFYTKIDNLANSTLTKMSKAVKVLV